MTSDENRSVQYTIWFSRILRWVLGIFFIGVGVWYYNDGAWPALIFGAVFFVTGFFKPRRCIDGSCAVPGKN
ncbi:MAG: hypothetical protein KIT80_02860 [Chitinophagaceae bacterium]|nr:hypothetical protein [Chitinophagaceae bacterium]MCW5925826.1 hypothetical protein [Chitinophagaceae bacterium]